MKFAKLSMAAIVAVGFSSSAVAGESGITINPFGTAKLFYETATTDADGANDLFSKDSAAAQARISGGATGKLNSCLGYGFEYMAVDTLGLENNLVSNTAMGYGRESAARYGEFSKTNPDLVAGLVETQHWAPQAYLTYSPCDTFMSNTTFKIGRQYLDTPLAFTENWKIAPNSFDAAVVMNKDIINTTLVGAYVGRGNGMAGRVTSGSDFGTYAAEGAYAVGAITSLMDGSIPLSVWAYDVVNVAHAVWADAGYKLNLGDMNLNFGGQYGFMTPDADGADDSSGFGLKVGTGMKVADMNFGLMAAYSTIDDDGVLSLANTATGGKKTKLYTAGIYTDGLYVAKPGSDAFKIKASTKLAGIGSLTAQYVNNENSNDATRDVSEIDVILGTSLPGGVGAKLIYINRDHDSGLTNDHVRVVLSSKF